MTPLEINALGVFVPAPLVWAVAAALLIYAITPLLSRFPPRRWHPHLFDIALFVVLWWAVSTIGSRGATGLAVL